MSTAAQWTTFNRWMANSHTGAMAPPHVQAAIDQIERHAEAENPTLSREEIIGHLDEIEGDLAGRAKRRQAEQELADYIAAVGASQNRPDFVELAESLDHCRTSGVVGVGDGIQVAWDHKCGQVRLCPDESRIETQRIAETYVPEITKWLSGGHNRRVFYMVLTEHNYRAGSLASGKKHQFEKYREIFQGDLDACPVDYHHGKPLATRKRKIKRFTGLKGALIVQEDPLSADNEWNVHLNVFLLWEGACDWSYMRQEWGANFHIRELKKQGLTRTVLEAVKYSAQIVPSKSESKRHQTDAPAMSEWPHELWAEWWDAQRGSRRVRSYGCLYALHRRRWTEASEDKRRLWLGQCGYDYGMASGEWGEVPEKQKVKLRKAMAGVLERNHAAEVHWVAQANFEPLAGTYSVNLIPENNFSGSANKNNKFGVGEVPDYGGPPPDYAQYAQMSGDYQ